jgi:hypothetical protein
VAGSFTAATCTTATGTATDADGSPVTVRINEGATLIASGPAAPAFSIPLSFPPITDGLTKLHTLRAYAVDIPLGTQVQLLSDQVATCTPPPPTISISAVPPAIPSGDVSVVTWTTGGALSCTGSGGSAGWAGARAVSGSFPTGPLLATTTYTLTCTNDGGPFSSSATITVGAPPPPTAVITSVDQPDYCISGPSAIVHWDYTSTAGLPMSHWQLQAATDPLFATIVYDSMPQLAQLETPSRTGRFSATTLLREVLGATVSRVVRALISVVWAAPLTEPHQASIPTGILQYGTTYHVRVQVWDGATVPPALTGWSAGSSFDTPAGAYPVASVSVDPLPPLAALPATFTDVSDYGSEPADWREWDFGDGTVLTESPAGPPAVQHTYASLSAGITAFLRVHNANMPFGTFCEIPMPFSVSPAIPGYKEVLPGLRQ